MNELWQGSSRLRLNLHNKVKWCRNWFVANQSLLNWGASPSSYMGFIHIQMLRTDHYVNIYYCNYRRKRAQKDRARCSILAANAVFSIRHYRHCSIGGPKLLFLVISVLLWIRFLPNWLSLLLAIIRVGETSLSLGRHHSSQKNDYEHIVDVVMVHQAQITLVYLLWQCSLADCLIHID